MGGPRPSNVGDCIVNEGVTKVRTEVYDAVSKGQQ